MLALVANARMRGFDSTLLLITPMNTPAYADLCATFTRLHHLSNLGAIAGWDQAATLAVTLGSAITLDASWCTVSGFIFSARKAPRYASAWLLPLAMS
jgi:hypothetical protein